MEDAIGALGGQHFLQMQNRVESGRAYSFYNEEISGLDIATIYTEYLASQPENGLAVREREVFGKKQDYSVLFYRTKVGTSLFAGRGRCPTQALSAI